MTDNASPAVVWFRDDLRLADNPALAAAVESGRPVVALHVLDEVSAGVRALGGAKRWWLHHALAALARDLEVHGVRLVLRSGAAAQIVPALAAEIGAGLVVWTRRYGAAEIAVDTAVKSALKGSGIEARSFNGQLLHEPWEVRNGEDRPFRVFSPFWRAARARGGCRAPLPAPRAIRPLAAEVPGEAPEARRLLPTRPDWAGGLRATWTPGEAGARARLERFVAGGLAGYAENRNRPDLPSTSMLSPHLATGDISPVQVLTAASHAFETGRTRASAKDLDKFESEIGWREFSFHLLGQFPALGHENFQPRFDDFPWRDDPAGFEAWCRGRTGYPIVDAGMRELWTTGWMHNRVRMIAASFLVKDLLVDWRHGERWFWDTLVDADPANNTASWQWVAGTGADAAPYFRIFNPITQGMKFDPDGDYIRRFLPELAKLPTACIHAPFEAPREVLAHAGVVLGRDYPRPIVDHAEARDRALAALQTIKAVA